MVLVYCHTFIWPFLKVSCWTIYCWLVNKTSRDKRNANEKRKRCNRISSDITLGRNYPSVVLWVHCDFAKIVERTLNKKYKPENVPLSSSQLQIVLCLLVSVTLNTSTWWSEVYWFNRWQWLVWSTICTIWQIT